MRNVFEKIAIKLWNINIISILYTLFRFSVEKRNFVMVFHCNLTIEGKYTAKGKLLSYPIDGDGDAKFVLSKYNNSDLIVIYIILQYYILLVMNSIKVVLLFETEYAIEVFSNILFIFEKKNNSVFFIISMKY